MTPSEGKFVGIQVSPVSFVDEGTDALLDRLQDRFGINVLFIGTAAIESIKS